MFNAKALTEKWAPVLGHEGSSAITDNYRKSVTAVLLENQERFMREERGMLNEAGGSAGNNCLLYTSPSPRDLSTSRMPSSA